MNASNPVLSPNTIQDATGDLAGCTAVAVSYYHSCAICGGRPMCWGENQFAQLGRGIGGLGDTDRAGPVDVPPGLTFTGVATFEGGGCAVTDGGRLFCWGDSWRGEVGTGGSSRSLPTPVAAAGS